MSVREMRKMLTRHTAKRGEAAAQELFDDVFTRSMTIDQLISGPPMMRNMMGMGGDIPPEAAAASKAVLEAFPEN